jgi:hypothetical protein
MDATIDYAHGRRLNTACAQLLADAPELDPGDPELFRTDIHWSCFDRVRNRSQILGLLAGS